ncbi:TadE/TadG family type IV pilus assembly protein [Vibrio mexicanus]|uniref:TadE/TadG family type IV pilus assembly protein n=1 Tax=Vibrio mexicanus TaxID=1004326 RepID=UPI00063C8F5C|nr:TadE family protein [Vibrio mexicanus]
MKQLKQKGLSTIEFTLVATSLLLLMLAVFEFGRYVYSMQVINEITRVAARLGVVCYVTDQDDIANLAIPDFAPPNFDSSNISIQYLDGSGSQITGTLTDSDVFPTIRYVRASVVDYDYQFSGLMSFLGESGVLSVPVFETTLPVESLGIYADYSAQTDC